LCEFDLHSLAHKDDTLLFNPIQAAIELLAEFDAKDQMMLDRLLARGLRPVQTLEEIGVKLNVTRERVRQLETQVANRLARLLETEKYASVRRHADTLTDLLGAAFPVKDLPNELAPDREPSLVDELFAYLAGPFIQCDAWYVRRDTASSVEDLLHDAYKSAANEFLAPLDALQDALEAAGVRPERTLEVIAACPRYHLVDQNVVPWSGIREKVVGVLQAVGKPMTFEEIQAAVLDGESASSVRNILASSPLVKRLKKNEWGLASWEGAEYRTIVDHMRDELQGGSLTVHELVNRLHEKFDISTASSTMYASMHPMFVNTGGSVRIRREDEPYIPTASLEMTPDCFQIDGAWSVTYTVDKDLLRGSGRVMPEAFAVHIGLQPGGNGEMRVLDRVVKVGWNMNPYFGSLRWIVEQEGLREGDLLTVIRIKPSELGFRFVRAQELSNMLSPAARLQKLVGATGDRLVLERLLGDALGLGGASIPTIPQLKARLQARGEKKLVALLEAAAP
jgi:DNA polymerase-3 subunit epsilon